ncbi:MAG TPA: aminotransferase class I/II-fold pyridoxal phosphate-dependent enzyme, partial [Dehalococcoidia bacterium]|nr:aminotransferase class I/II-fold pyridoxal phosphate-dependent enzyme [Dehalococcoidia bacterium]
DILEAMMKVHQYIIMSAPTPSQYAALEAIRHGEEESQLMIADFNERRLLTVQKLAEMALECPEPRGAFYAFPSIKSTGLDDVEFAQRLLQEEGVAVIPGSAFGEYGAGHVRICYASPRPLLEQGLERMAGFVQRL